MCCYRLVLCKLRRENCLVSLFFASSALSPFPFVLLSPVSLSGPLFTSPAYMHLVDPCAWHWFMALNFPITLTSFSRSQWDIQGRSPEVIIIPLSSYFFFRAIPVAYEISQARGWIRAIAASYTTGTAAPDLNHISNLHHSTACSNVGSLTHWARSGILYTHGHYVGFLTFWATMGTPVILFSL